jgi:hypothetical protein
MYASKAATNSSMVVDSQLREKNISTFQATKEACAGGVVRRASFA